MAEAVLTAPKLQGVEPKEEELWVVVRDLELGVFAETVVKATLLPASIEGVVVSGGKPMANVEVFIDMDIDGVRYTVSTMTDAEGRYQLVVPKVDFTYEVTIRVPVTVGNRTVLMEVKQLAFVGGHTEPGTTVPASNQISGYLFMAGHASSDGPLSIADVLKHDKPIVGRIFDANGTELTDKTVTITPDGKYQVSDLPVGTYSMLFQIIAPNGERLAGIRKTVTINRNGEVVIESDLIDPYGIVSNAVTNAPIEGAQMKLYWADTDLNKSKGRPVNGEVPLPMLEFFAPNENRNPQETTAAGEYAWMVFADGDYYLVGTKSGYITFDSRNDTREADLGDSWIRNGIIHVGETIVEYDLAMTPIESAPAAPALKVKEMKNAGVVLEWTPVPGPGQITYSVYRNGVLIAEGLTAVTYEDNGLATDTLYKYEVVAVNDAGPSPKSNEVPVEIQSLEQINEDIRDALKKLKVQYAPGDIWESITLPLFLVKDGSNNTLVGWESNNENVIKISQEAVYDDDGNGMKEFVAVVHRQSVDTSVILTATVRKANGTPLSRTFLLIVKSDAVAEEKETVARGNSSVVTNGEEIPVAINRTTLSNGVKIDKLILSTDAMNELLNVNGGKKELQLEFSDTAGAGPNARADELAVEIPNQAVEALDPSNTLHIETPEGSIKLSAATLSSIRNLGTDLFFRVVPIRDPAQRDAIANVTEQDALVKAAAGTNKIEVLDIPREIESNYTGLDTEIILPFRNLTLPTEPAARQQYLNSIRVFIQHSDGTKRVVGGNGPDDIPGTIVYENGTPVGIAFTIPKFSTFTMFRVAQAPAAPVVPIAPQAPVLAVEAELTAPTAGTLEVVLTDAPAYFDKDALTVTIGGKPAAIVKVELQGNRLIIHTGQPIPQGQRIVVAYDATAAAKKNQWKELASFELELGNHGKHQKYINGYPDGRFRPENSITRAEMAAILSRLLGRGGEKHEAVSYPDVADTHWAASYIEVMKQSGVMGGYDDGEFKPDQPITRGEFAAVLLRFIGRNTGATYSKYSFPDVTDHWARDLIESLNALGIMVGEDGMFYPNRNLSRAEAVTAINRAIGRGELTGDFSPSWPDAEAGHWAYGHIEEASRSHEYTRISVEAELLIRFLD